MNRYRLPLLLFTAATFLFPGRVCAQTDTLKNRLSIKLLSLTHGEACGGGLPRASASTEDKSSFLFGRNRLIVGYDRPGLEIQTVFQNTAVWGMKGNQGVNLYEGWVKMSSRHGLFVQSGRVALSYDDERIIGTNEFATAAQSHDVVRLGYEGHGHKLHAILLTTRMRTTCIPAPITMAVRSITRLCRRCGTTMTFPSSRSGHRCL